MYVREIVIMSYANTGLMKTNNSIPYAFGMFLFIYIYHYIAIHLTIQDSITGTTIF